MPEHELDKAKQGHHKNPPGNEKCAFVAARAARCPTGSIGAERKAVAQDGIEQEVESRDRHHSPIEEKEDYCNESGRSNGPETSPSKTFARRFFDHELGYREKVRLQRLG